MYRYCLMIQTLLKTSKAFAHGEVAMTRKGWLIGFRDADSIRTVSDSVVLGPGPDL